MADEKINIVVTLKDNASKAIKGMQDGISKLSNVTKLFAVAGIGALVAGINKCVNAFGEEQAATVKLKAALKATGQEVEGNTASMLKFAAEIQNTTTVADDAAVGLMQIGVSMGLSADQAKNATIAAIGLSKAYGTDLEGGMKMAAAAQMGNYDLLKRTIPELKNITDETVLAARAQQLLGAAFDVAKAETQTYSGAMAQLQNSVGDLLEIVGSWFAPVLTKAAQLLRGMVDWLKEIPSVGTKVSVGFNNMQIAIIEFAQSGLINIKKLLLGFQKFLDILNKIPGIDINVDGAIENIDKLNGKLEEQKAKRQEDKAAELEEEQSHEEAKYQIRLNQQTIDAEMQAVMDEAAKAKKAEELEAFRAELMAKSEMELQQAGYTAQQIAAIKTLQEQKKNEALKQASKDYVGFIAKAAEEEKNIAQAVAKGSLEFIKDGLKKQILAKSAELVEIGTAMLIATLGASPQGWAHLVGGATLAAGGVAAVNSIQLAEGGIVQPQPGGVSATIAEAGQAEAVIPLDSPEAKGMLGGGNNISINISGKPLAKEMYEIQQEMIRTGELSA